MYIPPPLPVYEIAGVRTRPGDINGFTAFGSLIEHTWLHGFYGQIAHVASPADFFRLGQVEEVLKNGGKFRVVHPTHSLEETQRRFQRANQIMGVSWWEMNCHATTDYIVGLGTRCN